MDNGATALNERVLLVSRPNGKPEAANFRIEHQPVPTPGAGEVLLETLWLSIEPYMALGMKGSMKCTTNPGRGRLLELCDRYIAGVEVGAVMYGPTVSRVKQSRNPEFSEGDIVLAYSGWQTYALDDCLTLRRLPPSVVPDRASLGVLGIPGMTAYAGMRLGAAKVGETVVVSAALGPVGSLAGQIAKIAGARVVGIASGDLKCKDLVEKLGFDLALDRLAPDFDAQLANACPNGIDLYFENAGGAVWWAVFELLNPFARVVVSGLASHYTDSNTLIGQDRSYELMQKLQLQRLRIEGISVFDHSDLEDDFLRDVSNWIIEGKVRYIEDIVVGLHNAPRALSDVLSGRSHGKLTLQVAS